MAGTILFKKISLKIKNFSHIFSQTHFSFPYEKAVDKLKELEVEKGRRENRGRGLYIFIESTKVQYLVADIWNDELWLGLVDHATVHSAGSITFKFKNGTEITVGAEYAPAVFNC